MKTMEIPGMLNTDLSKLNGSSLILKNDRLSMYIFLKFTCGIGKNTKTYFLIIKKTFFQNQRFG